MAEPTGSFNISQSLFQLDEKLSQQPKGPDFTPEFNAFINQSRVSTYYQDNPWQSLQFSGQFGLPTMGGPINYGIGAGSKPYNPYWPSGPQEPSAANAALSSEYNVLTNTNTNPVMVNGILVPQFMAQPIKNKKVQ
jgi:hypothetical protein